MIVKEGLPTQTACRVLGVSESGFYDWRKRSPSPWSIRHIWLTDMIRQVHVASLGAYGANRVHAELTMGYGITVEYNAVAMPMRRADLAGLPGSRRRRQPIIRCETAADLVDRDFARTEPDQLWVTDIAEHRAREGKVYCEVVLDVFSRWVVGWSIDSSPTSNLVASALGMAIDNRRTDWTVVHADQAIQCTSLAFTHRARPIRAGPLHGIGWGLFRQCCHRIGLGSDAGRVVEPAAGRTRIELVNAIFEHLDIFRNPARKPLQPSGCEPRTNTRIHHDNPTVALPSQAS